MNHDQKMWCREFTLNIFEFFFRSLMCIVPALDFERRKEKTGCEA